MTFYGNTSDMFFIAKRIPSIKSLTMVKNRNEARLISHCGIVSGCNPLEVNFRPFDDNSVVELTSSSKITLL